MGEDVDPTPISRILSAAGEGRPVDMDALLPLVYGHLRAIAARKMQSERPGHTLSATALVHEAYLKLNARDDLSFAGKGHFYSAAAEAMRRILIDHARARGSAKRGGGRRGLPLDIVDLASREDFEEILSVDDAVIRLQEMDPRMAEVVKLRFFAGLEVREIAGFLGVDERTIRRDWILARAWLERELSRE